MIKFVSLCLISLFFLPGCMKSQWESATGKNTKDAYSDFLKQYPDGEYKNEALQKIESLDYQEAKNTDTIEIYDEFINKYPNSKSVSNAQQNIERLYLVYFENSKSSKDPKELELYISKYPKSKYRAEAAIILENLIYSNAIKDKSISSCEIYINTRLSSFLRQKNIST